MKLLRQRQAVSEAPLTLFIVVFFRKLLCLKWSELTFGPAAQDCPSCWPALTLLRPEPGLRWGTTHRTRLYWLLLWLILCCSGRRNSWISRLCKPLKYTYDYTSCPGCVFELLLVFDQLYRVKASLFKPDQSHGSVSSLGAVRRTLIYTITLLFHEFCQGKLVLWGRAGPLQDVWWSEWSAARRRDSSCIMYVCGWVYEGLLRVWHPTGAP